VAELAQTYVHLSSYGVDAETINRLGTAAQEHAVAAAREIYRGNVTIDVRLEEGSVRLWVTVYGALSVLHVGYGVIADYKGFKEGIVAICEDAQKFGTFVSDLFLKDAAATPSQIYRVERRRKLPGKIKRVIEELERLENTQLSDTELSARLEAVQQKLVQIERELSSQEVAGLHQMLLHFEKLTPLLETLTPLEELPRSHGRPTLPRVAIRTARPTFSIGRRLIRYTEPQHVWDMDVGASDSDETNQTFHQRVFVQAVDDKDAKKHEETLPIQN
jgi:hypothetical protein